MIIPSLILTSPYEYYRFFDGSLVISKHLTGVLLLLIFAVLAVLYENRVQRIIDTIKSGVKIPSVTFEDQVKNLWQKKLLILKVFRDYLPFLLCILAHQKLLSILEQKITIHQFENIISNSTRYNILSYIISFPKLKDIMYITHKTYLLIVPVLAVYLYFFKQFKQFRQFLFSVIIISIMDLAMLYFFNIKLSTPIIYTAIVLFYSLIIDKSLFLFFISIAILIFFTDFMIFATNHIITLLSISLGVISIFISRYAIMRRHS